MFKFTKIEMRGLQLGQTIGPFLATKREVHNAQANICARRSLYPGAEFEIKTQPAIGMLPNGEQHKLKGWYNVTVKRTGIGFSAEDGTQEDIVY